MIQPLRDLLSFPRRRPWLTLLASLIVLIGAGIGCAFLWAQYHLHAAQAALERFAFEEAQHHVDLCLKVRSGSAAVQLLAAQTARRRDAYDEAERHLAESIRLGGTTEAASLERLLLTAQQGELDGLEASLRGRTAEDDPQALTVLEALAKGYANRFWETNTLMCLNILLGRQPRHPLGLLMRARTWEHRVQQGEWEHNRDALRDYQEAVEVAPTFAARLGLARTLLRMGHAWDALGIYEQLRPSHPADSEVLLGLARCKYLLNEGDEAQRLLDELLERYPRHADALLERGRLELHLGHFPEAEKWLRQAAANAPSYPCDAQRSLCQCLEALGRKEEARNELDELHRREVAFLEVQRQTLRANRQPTDVALRYRIAQENLRLGREAEGVAALFFVLDQNPRHGGAHAALADYFERSGQPGRAARHRRLQTIADDKVTR